ncbi:MAG: polysaccharide biosynthesis protein, partial [Spirochaetia bacterium]|nr:polysaccharide biosynthesis protein [Spirochaetia bacterium]
MKDKLLHNKRYLVLPLDMLLAFTSFYLACVLRFDGFLPPRWETFPGWTEYFHVVAILVAVRAVFFASMGLYRRLWAYASIHDIALILKATAVSSLAATVALLFYNRLDGMSRSVLVLDALLLFLLLSFRSFSWRILRDLVFMRKSRNGKRTLIIGAGFMGNRLLTELRTTPDLPYQALGFLDDSR